jgi:hypothetical protein
MKTIFVLIGALILCTIFALSSCSYNGYEDEPMPPKSTADTLITR